jgi:hypothetical protein
MESGTLLSYWSTRTVHCHQLYCSSLSVSVTRTFRLLRTAGVTVACIGYIDVRLSVRPPVCLSVRPSICLSVCLSVSVTPITLPMCQSELHLSTDQGLSIILVSIIELRVWAIFPHLKLIPFFPPTFINIKIRVQYILTRGTFRITFRISIISSIFSHSYLSSKTRSANFDYLHCIWYHVYVHTILL